MRRCLLHGPHGLPRRCAPRSDGVRGHGLFAVPPPGHSPLVTKPQVSAWLLSEWPDWYGPDGPGDLSGDVEAFARSDSALPVGLIICRDGEPIGFGALKRESIPSHAHLTPWAAAGYVVPSCRGQGAGAFLLRALVERAATLGFPRVHCGTSTAVTLLRRAGWQEFEVITHAGKPLSLFSSRP